MNSRDLDKTYVSPYDQFLFAFDAAHAPSASQLNELKKHQRIFALRDAPSALDASDNLFDDEGSLR